MASLAEAVILTDILGVVRSVNPAAEELSGWRASDLIGKTIDEALARSRPSRRAASDFLDLRAPARAPMRRELPVSLPAKEKKSGSRSAPRPSSTSSPAQSSGVTALLRKI